MPGKYAPDRVFNPLKRRIFRTRALRYESAVTVGLVVILLVAGGWILAQRDAFDPGERDISMEALVQGRIDELPYHAPLRRWGEAAGGASTGAPDLGIFPGGLTGAGWKLDGRVETYDPSNLYEKINGQAEQYLKFAFRELHYVTVSLDGLYLTAELYDQTAFRNALGVFASQRDPDQPVESAGGMHYYRTSVGAVGILENWFFKLTASATDQRVQDKTAQILTLLPALPLDSSDADAPFQVLAEGLGVSFERIAFVKENALQYDFLKDTWFGGLEADARVFVHRAPAADEAGALFERLVSEQGYEHQTVESGESRTVMRHEYLGTFFATAHRGGWLYGVDGAPDAESARDLMERLERELS